MTATAWPLLSHALDALRRPTTWWTIGTTAFVVLNAAFWPGLEASEMLQGFEDMGSLLEAFGAQDLASAAGYLDGQIFVLMLPLLLSGMAIAAITGLTSGDEGGGRLELLHALPVSRTAVWLSRWIATVVMLAATSVVVGAAVLVSLVVFSFDGVSGWRVSGAVLGSALLAAFHAALAYVGAALGWSRGRSVGAAVLGLVTAYAMSFVLPLAGSLQGVRRWSPWYWALGRAPVVDGVSFDRLALLAGVTSVLVYLASVSVNRRDLRSA